MPTDYKNLGDRQGGDPNILRLKDVNRVRPLDNMVAEWRQHGIEHPSDPEQFAAVVCPGPRSCPLDRKPVTADGKARFQVSRRFAANVWDYDTNSVKVLVAGPQVFDEFKAAAKVGIDPSSCDWTITKSGSGINTKYEVIRHDAKAFAAQTITPDDLHDVTKYEQPASTEAIFEVLEKFGIDYDSLSTPSYTYDEALAFVMPYTKHKGDTVEQMVSHEQSFAEWLHGTKLEQGALGDPVFLALQTVLEERGLVPPLEEALSMAPEPQAPTPVERRVTVNQVEAGGGGALPATETLIGPDGASVDVPTSAVETMLSAGFKRPEPATRADASAPTDVVINGQTVTLPREQALLLIDAGTATRPPEADEPEATEPEFSIPLPDEVVQVDVNGTEVPMPFVQAEQVVKATEGAKFVDERIQQVLDHAAREQAGAPDATADKPPAPAPDDPERPHKCDQCDRAFKTPGALTNHKNREHKAAEPQQPAVPAASNGSPGLAQEVRDLVTQAPFARDFQFMLDMFKSEANGKTNLADMTEQELAQVKARLREEMAKAEA